MKKTFFKIITFIAVCSFSLIFASCTEKEQTDDSIFYSRSAAVGPIRLDLDCKRECDAESIEFNCQYGYHNKDSVQMPPSGWNGYSFDKVVFLYDQLSWDELRVKAYNSYYHHESIDIISVNSFREYMEKEVNERYCVIREIPQEDFLTDEYYVKTGGLFRETTRKYNHQEAVSVLQEQLLPESGFICFGIYSVFYSEDKNDYIVSCNNTTGYIKYTINDGKVKFERVSCEYRNNKIIYSDEDGNVIWEDTESITD